MGCDVTLFEVKEIVGEYDFVAKQLYQMKDVSKLMLEMAELYETDQKVRLELDSRYGEGAADYIGKAIKAFYKS